MQFRMGTFWSLYREFQKGQGRVDVLECINSLFSRTDSDGYPTMNYIEAIWRTINITNNRLIENLINITQKALPSTILSCTPD